MNPKKDRRAFMRPPILGRKGLHKTGGTYLTELFATNLQNDLYRLKKVYCNLLES